MKYPDNIREVLCLNSKYFLGANSSEGFYSLYGNFCRGEGDYLSIIKGGPGTGKSGFMRKIGKAAEQAGFDVEYVLCSGDPASLDGVYIPTLRRGWMDGTSPHIAEPGCFGVDGDYIDLSRFCSVPLERTQAAVAGKLCKGYKAQYEAAYGYLKAASAVKNAECAYLSDGEKLIIEKSISSVLPKRRHRSREGKRKYRFLRCLSGEGEITLDAELEKNKVFTLLGGRRAARYALRLLMSEAVLRGFSPVVCLSPQDPSEIEALIIRETETAVTDRHYNISRAKCIALPAEELQSEERKNTEKTLMSCAYDCLANAKKQHDELEEIYKKDMDFDALTAFTDSYIADFFK